MRTIGHCPGNARDCPSLKIQCYLVYHGPSKRWLTPARTWSDSINDAAGCKSWEQGWDAVYHSEQDCEECYVFASDIGIEEHLLIDVPVWDWRDHAK
jgi:hypothetical protein